MATWVSSCVLHAVRPPPEDLPDAQLGDVAEQRLGLQDDVALLDELLAGPEAGDPALELVVGHAEAVPVATFEVDALPQVIGNPTEVLGMEREPALVLLARSGHDAKAQLVHAVSFGWGHPVLRPVSGNAAGVQGRPCVVSVRLGRVTVGAIPYARYSAASGQRNGSRAARPTRFRYRTTTR